MNSTHEPTSNTISRENHNMWPYMRCIIDKLLIRLFNIFNVQVFKSFI